MAAFKGERAAKLSLGIGGLPATTDCPHCVQTMRTLSPSRLRVFQFRSGFDLAALRPKAPPILGVDRIRDAVYSGWL